MSSLSTTAGSARAADAWPPGFVALYHDRYGDMVRLARLIVSRNDVAEELVQDCYLKIARRWDDIEVHGAYLRRAVVNAGRSYLRSHGRLRPLSAAAEPVTGPPEYHDVWRELDRLSPRRRVAVVLRYYEDLDDVEIGRILGCKPATVRSLVHRALKQLEEVLA